MEQAEATDEDGEYQPEVDPPDFVKRLAEKARGDAVSAERLIGDDHYFYNVVNSLNENEVPHYLFPLTNGVFADSSLVVDSGAGREELLNNTDGGSCVITNQNIKVISSKGEWAIPYNSLTSIDFVGHPALHIQTSGRTYYIKLSGSLFSNEVELKEAVEYVRQKQAGRDREIMEQPADSSLDVLKELDDLRKEGIITKE